jgi:hypothetical protein
MGVMYATCRARILRARVENHDMFCGEARNVRALSICAQDRPTCIANTVGKMRRRRHVVIYCAHCGPKQTYGAHINAVNKESFHTALKNTTFLVEDWGSNECIPRTSQYLKARSPARKYG